MKLRIYQKTADGPVGPGVSADPGEFFVVDLDSDIGRSFAETCNYKASARAVAIDGIEGVAVPDTVFNGEVPINPLPVLNGELDVVAVVKKNRARLFKTVLARSEFITAHDFDARQLEAQTAKKCEQCEDEECDAEKCPKADTETAQKAESNDSVTETAETGSAE